VKYISYPKLWGSGASADSGIILRVRGLGLELKIRARLPAEIYPAKGQTVPWQLKHRGQTVAEREIYYDL